MITSIVGRLIKKPETVERINIPGKHLVNFTVVQNSTHADKRLSVFFNLSMVIGTDNQYNLAMRFEKGTVLLFTAPRITYVRQTERGEVDQSINIYAEVENFKIVAGLDTAPASNGFPAEDAPIEEAAPARRPAPSAPPARSAPGGSLVQDAVDADDPFEDTPAPARPASARAASAPPTPKRPASQSVPARRSAPPPTDDDLAALGDPFAA